MNKEEKFVITINRQFGTNGRQIATALAEKLQVQLVDKQILNNLVEKLDVSEQEIEDLERKKKTWWQQVLYYASNNPKVSPTPSFSELTSTDLYKEQVTIMKAFAEEGSCVIVGRCGFEVFRNHPNHLSFFLFSDFNDRVMKVMQMYGITKKEAESRIKEVDSARESFTLEQTGKDRNNATNYDISINVSKLGEQGTLDLILSLIA